MDTECKQSDTSQDIPSSAQEVWEQVGKQIKSFGESLTAALRFTWNDETYQQHKQAIEQGFDKLVKEVSSTIHEGLQSDEAQQAKQQAQKVLDDVRSASEITLNELRPQLATALRRLNSEIEAIIEKLEQSASPPQTPAESKEQENTTSSPSA